MNIQANKVPSSQRLATLPKHFPGLFGALENKVYDSAKELCPSYTGGYWHFYELSNGGFYMAPDVDEPMTLTVIANQFEQTMSADAVGVVACLFAMGALASPSDENMIDHYHWLREYVGQHPEASAIYAAID